MGGAYPAQILYKTLADRACERITNALVAESADEGPVAIVNPFNPTGSTSNVSFTTSKTNLWETSSRCHINYAVLDSDWEGEMCRVLEDHPRVKAYVKNHNLGFSIPYLVSGERHLYFPDFIVVLDNDIRLIVEIKGFKNEQVNDKRLTTENLWIPAVNKLGSYGQWRFAQFESFFDIEADFRKFIDEVLEKG